MFHEHTSNSRLLEPLQNLLPPYRAVVESSQLGIE